MDLQSLISERCDDAAVLARIVSHGREVRNYDEDIDLPLHKAMLCRSSDVVILALLESFPDAASQRDSGDRLPLQRAAMTGRSCALVEDILRRFPQAADVPCHDREYTACHYAAEYGATDVLEMLLRASPTAADMVDERDMPSSPGGRTPLHLVAAQHARHGGAAESAVASLLRACPAAARVRDGAGDLALDLAVEAAAPDGLVALLLAADMPIHRGSGERDAESEHSWAASGADPRCAASRRLVLRPAGEGGCGFDAHAALLTSGDFCARLEVPGHSRHTCETPPDTLPSTTAPRQSVIESTTKYPPSDSNHATRLPPLASRRSGATRRWRIGARRWRGRPPPRHSAAACWSAPPCWPRPSAFAQRAAPLGGAPSPRNRATCER